MKACITICTGIPRDSTPGSGSWLSYGFTENDGTVLYVCPGATYIPDLTEEQLQKLPDYIAQWLRDGGIEVYESNL